MADTYREITLQIVFAVRFRESLIEDNFREDLHRYINGIIKNHDQKPIIINSMPDHIHILTDLNPNIRLADLVRDIKASSANYINKNRLSRNIFYWQNGYGVFSYGMSQRKRVINYIANQQNHHKDKSFRQEYTRLLEINRIKYQSKYLFDFFDP